jgi:hypothetical protein
VELRDFADGRQPREVVDSSEGCPQFRPF